MRYLAAFFFGLFLVSASGHGYAEERLAILEIKNNNKAVSPTELTYLAEVFRDLGLKVGKRGLLVMTKENILQMLPPGKSLEECLGECEVETGRKIGANYILSGEVLKLGDGLGFRLAVKIHQTKNGALLSSEIYVGKTFELLEKDVRDNPKKDVFLPLRPIAIAMVANTSIESATATTSKNLFLVDNEKAAAKACDGGDPEECIRLGIFQLDNRHNNEEADKLVSKACSLGSNRACGIRADLKGNKAEAKSLYAKACDGGDLMGCRNLGRTEYDEGKKVESRKLYSKACDGGEMRGCNDLGRLEYE